MTNAALVDTNWIILTQRHWTGWEKDHWFVFWCPSFMLWDNDNSRGETEVTVYHLLQHAINQHFCFPGVYLCACVSVRESYRVLGVGEGGLFQSGRDQCSTINLSDSVWGVKIEESAARSKELTKSTLLYTVQHRHTHMHSFPGDFPNHNHNHHMPNANANLNLDLTLTTDHKISCLPIGDMALVPNSTRRPQLIGL